jgi:CRP/FNR family cyclic AMP-dependent transcriptional regulator
VAVESTTVVELTRPTVLRLLADHPMVLEAMRSGLSRTVRRLTEQVHDLSFLDLPGRLAKVLLQREMIVLRDEDGLRERSEY